MSKKTVNVLSFLEDKTSEYNDRVALGMKSRYGWFEFTYGGLSAMSKTIAAYLINDAKLKKEENIAILSESRIEFGAVFFASIIAGTTFIPLDIKLTEHELYSILSSCNPRVLFVSNDYLDSAIKLKEKIASIQKIVLLDEMPNDFEYTNIYTMPYDENIKLRHRNLNSNALIIYTSGTTGNPKGVVITVKNLISQINDIKKEMKKIFKEGEKINTLSILPMNHLFELTVGFVSFLNLGYSIYYTKSLRPKDVLSVMKDKKIKFMTTVPSFFKMLKMQFEADSLKKSKLSKLIYNFNYHYVAKFFPLTFIKKFLFREIHSKFGNSFYGFLSGGATMDLNMAKYFNRIGVRVFQGYGLSEASPVVAFNDDKNGDIKSVGTFLDSFEAKIDKETGELLVKGPAVMKGYYNQKELTDEVIDKDGWLHTGDIARIDKKGRLFITGRIKNMIVLSGGKKVFPEEIEAALNGSQFVKEACALSVVKQTGEKKGAEEVCLVVNAKSELYKNYDDKIVEDMVVNEVKKKMLTLCQYKRPTNIIVLKQGLPKTATGKIKRKEVKELICGK